MPIHDNPYKGQHTFSVEGKGITLESVDDAAETIERLARELRNDKADPRKRQALAEAIMRHAAHIAGSV